MDPDEAVAYMNKVYGEKFGDEFALESAEYAGFQSKADNFLMTSKRFPGFYIRVCYFENRYTTDYMEMNYYEQYQEYYQSIFEEIFGECKTLYGFTLSTSVVYTENTTFEEFLKTDRTLKSFYVILKNDEKLGEKVAVLLEKLKADKTPLGNIRFITLNNYEDASDFQSINDWGHYRDNIEKGDLRMYYDYSFNRQYEVRD